MKQKPEPSSSTLRPLTRRNDFAPNVDGSTSPRLRRTYSTVVAALAWFTLGAQLLLFIVAAPLTPGKIAAACLAFLTYFTVWANLLVALAATGLAARSHRPIVFARPSAATAAATYILMVAAVNAFFLRQLWHPTGTQWVVDILLHDVIPLAYIGLWLLCVPKGQLRWHYPFQWLMVPLAFAAVNLTVAAATGFNAYPFLDATQCGLGRVLLHIAEFTAAFLSVGLVFVVLDRLLHRRR